VPEELGMKLKELLPAVVVIVWVACVAALGLCCSGHTSVRVLAILVGAASAVAAALATTPRSFAPDRTHRPSS